MLGLGLSIVRGAVIISAGTPPGVPQNLVATPGDGFVQLFWDPVSGAEYSVYRDGVLLIAHVSSDGYVDDTVINGTTYSYTVSAVNTGGESGQSDPATATPTAAPATLLGSYDISDDTNISSFARSVAAGYTGNGETAFQREAAVDTLRSAHYVSGSACVLLESTPTPCALVAPTSVVGTPSGLDFTITFDSVTGDVDHYEWRLDGTGSWATIASGDTKTSTAGDHTVDVRAVSPSDVAGATGTSDTFTLSSGGGSSLLTNLDAAWEGDESSGNLIDSLGTTDLTANGSPTASGGYRTLVAASSQYFSHADSAALSVSGDFTFSFEVNFTDASHRPIITKDDVGSNREFTFFFDGTNIQAFLFDSVSGFINVSCSESLSTGTAYIVVVWYDSNDKKLRISVNDGTAAVSAGALTNGPHDAAAAFTIGIDGSAYGNMAFRKVRKWSRVLDSTERTAINASPAYPFS